jgi:hypothetical protein
MGPWWNTSAAIVVPAATPFQWSFRGIGWAFVLRSCRRSS